MKKPTVEEVAAYCQERGNGIDSEAFVDYYEQVGWVCGKNRKPMKCWQSAVRLWERSRKKPTLIVDRLTDRSWAEGL